MQASLQARSPLPVCCAHIRIELHAPRYSALCDHTAGKCPNRGAPLARGSACGDQLYSMELLRVFLENICIS